MGGWVVLFPFLFDWLHIYCIYDSDMNAWRNTEKQREREREKEFRTSLFVTLSVWFLIGVFIVLYLDYTNYPPLVFVLAFF